MDTWYQKTKKIDYFFSKGLVESFLDRFNIPYEEKRSIFFNLFDCDESVDFYIGTHRIGSMGLVNQKIMNFYEITQPIYFAFFKIPLLQKYITKEKHHRNVSSTQDISRDIAFTVDKKVRTRNLLEKIKETAKDVIKEVIVFDVYAGQNIDENLKSIAVRMIFNFGENVSKEKIQEILDQIILELEKSYLITIRK